jgi:hypothetical protein
MAYLPRTLHHTTNMENKTTSLPNLAPALVKALAETQDIVADSTNPYHHNKYASLSQHLKSLKPIFAKHGLAIVQFPTSGFDSGVGVKTIILHTSGETLESSVVVNEPFEKGKDKNGNDFERKGFSGQQAGALISYLRRYALAAVAGVATEDDDAETDRVAQVGQEFVPNKTFVKNPNAAPAQTQQTDIDPTIVVPFGRSKGQQVGTLSKEDLKFWAEQWEPRPYEKTGRVTKKDATLKATAVHLYANAAPKNLQELAEMDDVPFGDEGNPF